MGPCDHAAGQSSASRRSGVIAAPLGLSLGGVAAVASASEDSAVGAGAEEVTLRLLYQFIANLIATRVVTLYVTARPHLRRVINGHIERHDGLGVSAVPCIVALLCVSAAITSRLGMFAIIGGFIVGSLLHQERRFVEEWSRRVTPIVWALLLPIFVAYTGLRTDFTAVIGG